MASPAIDGISRRRIGGRRMRRDKAAADASRNAWPVN
jgi:hypothetical protein